MPFPGTLYYPFDMEPPETLTLRFSNEEIPEALKRTAESLGISVEELAEAAIEHELALLGAGLEKKLDRIVDLLRSDRKRDLKKDIEQFARSEVMFEDPLRSRMAGPEEDPYGIGAVFGRRLDRG